MNLLLLVQVFQLALIIYYLSMGVFIGLCSVIDNQIKAPLLTMIGGAAVLVAIMAGVMSTSEITSTGADSMGTLTSFSGTYFGALIVIWGSWYWLATTAQVSKFPAFRWFLITFAPLLLLWLLIGYEAIASLGNRIAD